MTDLTLSPESSDLRSGDASRTIGTVRNVVTVAKPSSSYPTVTGMGEGGEQSIVASEQIEISRSTLLSRLLGGMLTRGAALASEEAEPLTSKGTYLVALGRGVGVGERPSAGELCRRP